MNNTSRIVALIGVTLAWVSLTAGAKASPSVSYRFQTVSGLRIFVRESGDPSKPTILLLHGFPTSSHMFRDLIPLLSDRFHVLAFDYPGMGYSEAPAPSFTSTFDSLAAVTVKRSRAPCATLKLTITTPATLR